MEINHNFKKKFGQNFLTDKNLLESIVNDAGITSDDVVLEIGAGAGALTEPLSCHAKKVVSFEIDKELIPLLNEKFAGKDNVQFVFGDFLSFSEKEIFALVGEKFKVVANLPYYITTPILSKLFEMEHAPETVVVMVQKEVAERLVADEKSSAYGYFSAYVSAYAKAKITRQVNRKMFTPMPNVDSAIVRFDLKKNPHEKEFSLFLQNVFKMKRKTLANNISSVYNLSKEEIDKKLENSNFSSKDRADNLSVSSLYEIYCLLFK